MIKIGDTIRDNDPRMPNRILEIIGKYDEDRVVCKRIDYPNFPAVRVRIDRIHTDGKKRRTGFDLISYERPD